MHGSHGARGNMLLGKASTSVLAKDGGSGVRTSFGFLVFSLSGAGSSGDIGVGGATGSGGVDSCCTCPPSCHHLSRAEEKVSGVVDEPKEQLVAMAWR